MIDEPAPLKNDLVSAERGERELVGLGIVIHVIHVPAAQILVRQGPLWMRLHP